MSETVCWCGSGKPYEDCHKEIEDEIRMHQLAGEEVPTRQMIKTPEQIAAEKKAKAEAEQKAREEAEKKAKEAEEKAKKAAEEKAKQEQALIKQNADQKKYHIFIKKSAFTLYLLDDKNNVIKAYDCTLGKNPGQKQKRGDMKTPTGTFLVDEICDASGWTHDFGDGKGEIKEHCLPPSL